VAVVVWYPSSRHSTSMSPSSRVTANVTGVPPISRVRMPLRSTVQPAPGGSVITVTS